MLKDIGFGHFFLYCIFNKNEQILSSLSKFKHHKVVWQNNEENPAFHTSLISRQSNYCGNEASPSFEASISKSIEFLQHSSISRFRLKTTKRKEFLPKHLVSGDVKEIFDVSFIEENKDSTVPVNLADHTAKHSRQKKLFL